MREQLEEELEPRATRHTGEGRGGPPENGSLDFRLTTGSLGYLHLLPGSPGSAGSYCIVSRPNCQLL